MEAFEQELQGVIVDALMIPEPLPAHFTPESNLFEALGLDSVDALEISMAIKRRYGVEFDAEDERTKEVFQTLRSLASYVASRRGAEA
jgi:acyl carrier protein